MLLNNCNCLRSPRLRQFDKFDLPRGISKVFCPKESLHPILSGHVGLDTIGLVSLLITPSMDSTTFPSGYRLEAKAAVHSWCIFQCIFALNNIANKVTQNVLAAKSHSGTRLPSAFLNQNPSFSHVFVVIHWCHRDVTLMITVFIIILWCGF